MRALLVALALVLVAPAAARAAVTLAQVGSYDQPVFVTGDADRLYIVERGGRIVAQRGPNRSAFLDISGRVDDSGGEEGLLSMALSGSRLFVYYTAPRDGGGSFITVSEFAATPDSADPATERVILRIEHPTYDNHNGGLVALGPDGRLWIGTGDGGSAGDPANNGQNTGTLLGKLLRVDPAAGNGCGGGCTIPAGNPGLPAPEVWAYGLRNPWRWSFDRLTGDLWIGDVGQNRFEEIDFAPAPARGAGFDWGWDAKEGYELFAGGVPADGKEVDPVHAYGRGDGRRSVVGGVVVRDPALPDLAGRYLFGDTYGGPIYSGVMEGGRLVVAPTSLTVSQLVSFGEDSCGRVYAVSISGPVYRLSDSGACGATPGPGPGPGGAGSDTTAPALVLRAAARQHPLRTGRVRVSALCDEQCTVGARASFLGHRTPTVERTLAAGARVSLQLRLGPRQRRTIRRTLARGRRVTVSFSVTARDAAGNTRRAIARARVVH